MRKVLDGEWGELQWIVHLEKQKKMRKKMERELYPFGIRCYEVVGIFRKSDL
jgi:hypothetical protein